MSKINQYSAAEKLVILQELETGQTSLKDIAKEYDLNQSTLFSRRQRYQLYGYEGLEIRTHNKSYPAELKLQAVQDYLSGKYSCPYHRRCSPNQ
jgi:transposase